VKLCNVVVVGDDRVSVEVNRLKDVTLRSCSFQNFGPRFSRSSDFL
jgi:hypothetical protein